MNEENKAELAKPGS